MKYYEKHACGHEGMIDLVGPGSQREWKLKRYFEDECPECQQKRHDAENALAAERAKLLELPKLIGTEKQTAWAESIRMKFCDISEECASKPDARYNADKAAAIVGCILDHEIYASFWIERGACRRETFVSFLMDYARSNKEKVLNYIEAPVSAPENAPQDDTACVLRPEDVRHDGIVTIEVLQTGDEAWTIRAFFVKDDDFRSVITKRRFEWDRDKRCWARSIGAMYGPGNDRAAEVVSRLLKSGFCVRCENETVREMVQAGDYKPENRLWVSRKNDTMLRFMFDRDMDLNEKVRKLGARWDGTGYEIPADRYSRIEEFARLYGFSTTQKAKEMLDAARAEVEGAPVVDPMVVAPLKPKNNPLAEILKSSREVLADLKDD